MFTKRFFVIPSSNRLSFIVLLSILLWFSIIPMTQKWENPLSWDVFGYYIYTPATAIWDDTELKNFAAVEEINKTYENTETYYQFNKTEQGAWMTKYTMGLALLEAPFFYVAHALAPKLGYPADGFSQPYQSAMIIAHFFYLLVGFVFLRKMLLKLFSDKITAALLFLVVAGTNYYAMGMLIRGVSPIHALEFSLISIFLFLIFSFHEKHTKRKALLLGIVSGFIILVRPSDILVIALTLLWGVDSFYAGIQKIKNAFKQHKVELILFFASLFIVLFPQLYYWKFVSGKWLLFSYNNNPGEGFEFLSPYLLEVLFSFRKGWLVYTPMMIFSVIGFIYLYKQKRELFIPILFFFILNTYLISSWSCWWYAGCFGQRAMVDSYPILLIPFGYFLNQLNLYTNKAVKGTGYFIIVFFVLLNIFQTWQYSNRILDGSRMTSAFYFQTFGKTKSTLTDKKWLLVDRDNSARLNEKEYDKRILFFEKYNLPMGDRKQQYNDSLAKEGKYCLQLDSGFIFTPKYESPYYSITANDHAWLRIKGWFYPTQIAQNNSLDVVITFVNYEEKLYYYRDIDITKQTKTTVKLNEWNQFSFDYLTPEVRNKNDKINIYFWYKGKAPVFIDDFLVQLFEKKE